MATIRGNEFRNTLNGTQNADTILGFGEDDTLTGRGGADLLNGGTGNDTLSGNAGRDTLGGGQGDDLLRGGSAADRLRGNAGDDTLNGGTQADTLLGGEGNDTYAGYRNGVSGALNFGEDIINDVGGNNDLLNLHQFSLQEVTFAALDLNRDGFLDALRVSPGVRLSPNTILIKNYFDDNSSVPEESDAGSGLIETIRLADTQLNFDDIQGIVITT